MKEDYQIIDQFPGYNSAGDKTKLPPGTMIRGSKNVHKKISGTIATRPGLKLRGSVDSTNAGTKASYEWDTNVGTTRVLRVNNNKLQVESDIVTSGTYVWYNLLLTSVLTNPAAALTRFVFDTWWDDNEKTDRLIMVRGDDKLLHWSGGIAKIASVTATTITLSGTTWAAAGFATALSAEKKIIINGAEYTYTGGEDTDTLTGVTGNPVGLVSAGDVAIQSVIIEDNTPVDTYSADYIIVINNQAWVGSYSSRVVYISADTDFRDFSNDGDFVYGDPDKITMDSNGKGIGISSDGRVVLFGGNADMLIITPNTNVTFQYDPTPGVTRLMYQKIEKKKLSGLTSALGHEFIGNLGEYLVWMDQKNRLRAQGTFANVNAIKPVSLSVQVQNELSEDDLTGGHLRVIQDNDGETIYITAPNNARDWMYQQRDVIDELGQVKTERIWQPPQIRGIQRFAVIDGIIYGHSNNYPQLYQVWDTDQYSDDHPSEELVPYTCRAFFAYNQHKERTKLKSFNKMYIEGYMPEGVSLNTKIRYDYQGATDSRDLVVDSDSDGASFWLGNTPPSLGDSSLGDNPLGDGIVPEGGNQEMVPKFRAILNVDQVNCFEYAPDIYSTETDSRWEILCFGTNAIIASQKPTFIRK